MIFTTVGFGACEHTFTLFFDQFYMREPILNLGSLSLDLAISFELSALYDAAAFSVPGFLLLRLHRLGLARPRSG